MARTRVCVLGSANMDLVALVNTAPGRGETVTGHGFEQVPGGKGANQALAAARAGGQVRMLGAVGDDAFGRTIREVLLADGVDVAGLATVQEAHTGTAHIVVDAKGGNAIVVVPGANGAVHRLLPAHRAAIAGADILLLQLEVPRELVEEAARHARTCGTRVVLTPAPVQPLPDELLSAVDLLVPNEHEACQLSGYDDPVKAASALLERGASAVAVTLGDRGCVYVARELDEVVMEPAADVTAVDTTAAGDTFVGCLAVAFGEQRPLRDALRWATMAAGLSVQQVGASSSMPRRPEIEAAFDGCVR